MSALRLNTAGDILKIGLFVCLLLEKVIFLGVVTQRLYIKQQNTRQGTFAVLDLAEVNGIALILIYGQTADIL